MYVDQGCAHGGRHGHPSDKIGTILDKMITTTNLLTSTKLSSWIKMLSFARHFTQNKMSTIYIES